MCSAECIGDRVSLLKSQAEKKSRKSENEINKHKMKKIENKNAVYADLESNSIDRINLQLLSFRLISPKGYLSISRRKTSRPVLHCPNKIYE